MKTPEQETKEAMADITRAHRAQELLNNPLYVEAVMVMKAAMFEQFNDTKLTDETIGQLITQFEVGIVQDWKILHGGAENTNHYLKIGYDQTECLDCPEEDFKVKVNDEEKTLLNEFYIVDREKLLKLDDETIASWARKGWMSLIDAHIDPLFSPQTKKEKT